MTKPQFNNQEHTRNIFKPGACCKSQDWIIQDFSGAICSGFLGGLGGFGPKNW